MEKTPDVCATLRFSLLAHLAAFLSSQIGEEEEDEVEEAKLLVMGCTCANWF